MGMRASLVALTPDQSEDAPETPDTAPRIDIDKAWHGIHFLLTAEPWSGKPPFVDVLMGGKEIGEDNGYGHPRIVSPDQVRAVAAALGPLTRDELAARFDADAMKAAEIYPQIWHEGDGARDYLMGHYVRLRDFYIGAAKRGDAVLVSVV
jgi:hypothetical protein